MHALPWITAVLGLFIVITEIVYSWVYWSLASTWVLMLVGLLFFLQGFYQIALHHALTSNDEPEEGN